MTTNYKKQQITIKVHKKRIENRIKLCYVRGMIGGGLLHTTSERGEGYIAYKLPGEKLGLKVALPIAKGFFRSMNLSEGVRFFKTLKSGGTALRTRLDKEKKPYIFVGLVCVPEKYQGQGYMRKTMERARFQRGKPTSRSRHSRNRRKIKV